MFPFYNKKKTENKKMRHQFIKLLVVITMLLMIVNAQKDQVKSITADTPIDYVKNEKMTKYLTMAHNKCLTECPSNLPACSKACNLLNPASTDTKAKGTSTCFDDHQILITAGISISTIQSTLHFQGI